MTGAGHEIRAIRARSNRKVEHMDIMRNAMRALDAQDNAASFTATHTATHERGQDLPPFAPGATLTMYGEVWQYNGADDWERVAGVDGSADVNGPSFDSVGTMDDDEMTGQEFTFAPGDDVDFLAEVAKHYGDYVDYVAEHFDGDTLAAYTAYRSVYSDPAASVDPYAAELAARAETIRKALHVLDRVDGVTSATYAGVESALATVTGQQAVHAATVAAVSA